MSYSCKKCGHPVFVSYRRFVGNGALMMISVENGDDKLVDVESCPECGARLLIFEDLEWTRPEEYQREKERTAAI